METNPEIDNGIVASSVSKKKTNKKQKTPLIFEDKESENNAVEAEAAAVAAADVEAADVEAAEAAEKERLLSIVRHHMDPNLHKQKPSRAQIYKEHGALPEIIEIVKLTGASLGIKMEKIARDVFDCLKERNKGKNNTGYDHIIELSPGRIIKIEQKSSCHWGKTNNYKWQHVEKNHPWEYIILCGIDIKIVHFWIMNRSVFNKLIEEKKITNQGNKTGESSEGMWFNYSDVANSLIKIRNTAELLNYVNSN